MTRHTIDGECTHGKRPDFISSPLDGNRDQVPIRPPIVDISTITVDRTLKSFFPPHYSQFTKSSEQYNEVRRGEGVRKVRDGRWVIRLWSRRAFPYIIQFERVTLSPELLGRSGPMRSLSRVGGLVVQRPAHEWIRESTMREQNGGLHMA